MFQQHFTTNQKKMTINRTLAPALQKIENLNLSEPRSFRINSNLTLYSFHHTSGEAIKLDIIFDKGKLSQSASLVNTAFLDLLFSGTDKYSSFEIMEKLDSLGAYVTTASDLNYSVLSVYCMSKYLKQVLEIVKDAFENVIFPESELAIYKDKKINSLRVNETKTSYRANKVLNFNVYGDINPIGYSATEQNIKNISRGTLLKHKKDNFSFEHCYMVLTHENNSDIDDITSVFASLNSQPSRRRLELAIKPSSTLTHNIHHDNAVQAGVRVGKTTINIHHDDYSYLAFANTILGGYFGSRLMSNIREEKGLTYGIHSSLATIEQYGNLKISTEVKNDSRDLCMDEIQKEIKLLQTELVSDEEMTIVRNYILGRFQRSISSPTSLSTRFISLNNNQLDNSFYPKYLKEINDCSAEDVLRVSNTYLTFDSLYKIIVGNLH
jgi:zinc protease